MIFAQFSFAKFIHFIISTVEKDSSQVFIAIIFEFGLTQIHQIQLFICHDIIHAI